MHKLGETIGGLGGDSTEGARSDLGQRGVTSAVQADLVAPGSDPSHQIWIVSRHLTDNEHSPGDAPFIKVVQQLVCNRAKTRLNEFVGPMILKVKRKNDVAHNRSPSALSLAAPPLIEPKHQAPLQPFHEPVFNGISGFLVVDLEEVFTHRLQFDYLLFEIVGLLAAVEAH